MNIISSFSSVRMSALCAFSALLMLSCQDNIEPENGKDDPGKPDDTEEPVDPPVESTDPALTAFTPLSGSNGAEVTLTGKNFGTDATAVKVYFIDTDLQTEKEATVVSVSDEEIKVTVPAGPGEECKIKVVIGETELVYDTLFDYVYQTVVSTLFGGAQTAAENPTGTFSFADAAFFGTFDNEHHTLVMGNDGCIYFALENSEKGFLNARRHNVYKTDLNAQTITCIGTVESWVSILPIAMDPKTNAIYGMRGDASEGKMAYYNGSVWDSEVAFTWDKKDNLTGNNGSACRAIAVRPSTGEIYFTAYGVLGVLDFNTKVAKNMGMIIEDLGTPGTFRTEPATGLVFDPNNDNILYISIADLGHIYKYTVDTQTCERVCGGYWDGYLSGYQDGELSGALLDHPGQICMDKNNNLYVADQYNCCIRKIDLTAGQITTLAGQKGKQGNTDGSLSDALFDDPTGIAVSSDGVVYVSERDNHGIRRIALE